MSSGLTNKTIIDGKQGLNFSLPIWDRNGEGVYYGKFLVNQYINYFT